MPDYISKGGCIKRDKYPLSRKGYESDVAGGKGGNSWKNELLIPNGLSRKRGQREL